jgi:thymidylate synthase
MQFYIQDEYIDLICFNRSSDVFLGLPFNIASTSLLLIIIAKLTGLVPRYVNISLGDSHIYEQHIKHIETQVNRRPFEFPILEIQKELNTLEQAENLQFTDFKLINYRHHPAISASMIA